MRLNGSNFGQDSIFSILRQQALLSGDNLARELLLLITRMKKPKLKNKMLPVCCLSSFDEQKFTREINRSETLADNNLTRQEARKKLLELSAPDPLNWLYERHAQGGVGNSTHLNRQRGSTQSP